MVPIFGMEGPSFLAEVERVESLISNETPDWSRQLQAVKEQGCT